MTEAVNVEILPLAQSLPAQINYGDELAIFESKLLSFIQEHGLPAESVLVPVRERVVVFGNIQNVLLLLPPNYKTQSIYISKFIAATGAGLFDAALNYLWNETIYELRKRVSKYDIDYFFDIAIKNPEKRKELKTEDDLAKVTDNDLINGAKEIELISELGYKQLDLIRYMRNWASAAHPNQNDLSGLQLVTWLETCIKEVITLPETNNQTQIRKLLENIKTNKLSSTEAAQVCSFFVDLNTDQASSLAEGFFGIYTNAKTGSETRDNIRQLAPKLGPFINTETKNSFGIKYGQFTASNEADKQQFAREFLTSINGLTFIPEGLRAVEIEEALENLLTAHNAPMNNFYLEPPAAKQLSAMISNSSDIPSQIKQRYAETLVNVFLTNGNGVAWGAEEEYLKMLRAMPEDQILLGLLAFRRADIASKLQFKLCKEKFLELGAIAESKMTKPQFKEIVKLIKEFRGSRENMHKDTGLMAKVDGLLAFL